MSDVSQCNNGRIVTRSEPLSDIEYYFNLNEETQITNLEPKISKSEFSLYEEQKLEIVKEYEFAFNLFENQYKFISQLEPLVE